MKIQIKKNTFCGSAAGNSLWLATEQPLLEPAGPFPKLPSQYQSHPAPPIPTSLAELHAIRFATAIAITEDHSYFPQSMDVQGRILPSVMHCHVNDLAVSHRGSVLFFLVYGCEGRILPSVMHCHVNDLAGSHRGSVLFSLVYGCVEPDFAVCHALSCK